MADPIYSRVLLKLSGEVLGGAAGSGLERPALEAVVAEVLDLASLGVEIGIVVGGGNILRGASGTGASFERTRGDRMGMLATVINALALEDELEARGLAAHTLTSTPMAPVAELFSARRARELLADGKILLFGGGTGHPFFSTDTAAALRALEIGAGALLKGTKVDGVYDRDPLRHPGATRFSRISHAEAIARNLRVMDMTALSLCQEQGLPIHVFSLMVPGTARRLLLGEDVGTLVTLGPTPGGEPTPTAP